MTDDTRRDEDSNVSRRRFLESTATAGGAALVGVVATAGGAARDITKPSASNHREANLPAQLTGEMIEYTSGSMKIPAYLSRPKKSGAAPSAVLVIHEIFGLNDHIKSIADRISNEGYVALAPNLLCVRRSRHRKIPRI